MSERDVRRRTSVLVVAVTTLVLAVLLGTASRQAAERAPAHPVPVTEPPPPSPTTTAPPSPLEQPAGVFHGVAREGARAVCALAGC